MLQGTLATHKGLLRTDNIQVVSTLGSRPSEQLLGASLAEGKVAKLLSAAPRTLKPLLCKSLRNLKHYPTTKPVAGNPFTGFVVGQDGNSRFANIRLDY
jgi:hypothetical protein